VALAIDYLLINSTCFPNAAYTIVYRPVPCLTKASHRQPFLYPIPQYVQFRPEKVLELGFFRFHPPAVPPFTVLQLLLLQRSLSYHIPSSSFTMFIARVSNCTFAGIKTELSQRRRRRQNIHYLLLPSFHALPFNHQEARFAIQTWGTITYPDFSFFCFSSSFAHAKLKPSD
jgi:hypothetical protein